MSDATPRARHRARPDLPDVPFLCATCRHGRVIVQKLQPWLLATEAWKDDSPDWFWQARCSSPQVTPWKFSIFCHPVVECDAYRPRKLVTTDDVARKAAKKGRKRGKGGKKNKKR